MGHVFTFATYDILQRLLEYKGHAVRLVRNVTDVDEPIYRRAAQLGVPYTQLAAEETAEFQSIMQQLNLRPAFAEPKASEYIQPMALAVQQLLQGGHAYRLENGDTYFDTATDPQFGKNSGFNHKLLMGLMRSRGGDPDREDKRNPLDFLLWRAVTDKQDPAAWESPVGYGRPGWHIECSVMSTELLGTPMDIHGGGMDLIFPHHECEDAQSRALGHVPFAKHWMHVAPLSYHGEKMSKSLGNLVFAKDLLKHHEPAVIRLAILRYHYRIGGEWRDDAMCAATKELELIRRAISAPHGPDPAPYLRKFVDELENDVYTPEALRALCDYAQASVGGHGKHKGHQDALRQMLDIVGVAL